MKSEKQDFHYWNLYSFGVLIVNKLSLRKAGLQLKGEGDIFLYYH